MCGIAGAIRAIETPEDPTVPTMLTALAHRGPDGSGLWRADGVAFGHHRLAIHDLSDAGAQPMTSRDGRFVLAINGTIHNAAELRRDPACAHYPFRGRSDSEVLLPLWAAEGERALERLEGPFALAMWDTVEQVLVLARDRFGKRPLYWTRTEGGDLLFASELRALISAGHGWEYDRGAAAGFLRAGYVTHHGSILKGVAQVPPAHRVRVTEAGEESKRFTQRRDGPGPGSLEEGLQASVDRRIHADRTAGVLLSGGLDSTAVALLASRGERPALPTFTMGFDDPRFDESECAAATAKHLRLPHHHWTFDADPGPLLRELVTTTGELLADSSWLPTALVCRRASEHATILLTGDGADELFGGYQRHRVAALSRKLGPLRGAATLLAPLIPGTRRKQGMRALARSPMAAVADLAGIVPENTLGPWLDPVARAEIDPLRAFMELPFGGELGTYLPYDLMAKVDRGAMISGIEVWSPFLDADVERFSSGSPWEGKPGKRQLRALLQDLGIPRDITSRRKRGFGVPLQAWLAHGSYGTFARTVLGDVKAPFRGVLRGGDALPILDRARDGDAALAPLAHACVVLALWWDAFMETDA